jgi:hypothetical protein
LLDTSVAKSVGVILLAGVSAKSLAQFWASAKILPRFHSRGSTERGVLLESKRKEIKKRIEYEDKGIRRRNNGNGGIIWLPSTIVVLRHENTFSNCYTKTQ